MFLFATVMEVKSTSLKSIINNHRNAHWIVAGVDVMI